MGRETLMKAFVSRGARLCRLSAAALVLVSGCRQGIEVKITGTLSSYMPGDRVFVALSERWENIYRSPKTFEIDDKGDFVLAFTIRKEVPPITFVKNGERYARLTLRDMWGREPKLVDDARGKMFPVEVDEDYVFKAHIML